MPDDSAIHDLLSDPDAVRSLHEGRERASSSDEDDASPEDDHKTNAQEWLGDLTLLQGVPFPYLLPDERALPKNSLRFFYVDKNWVRALREGALSVGRDHAAHEAHDEAFGDELKAAANRTATTIRARLLGQAPPDPEAAAQKLNGAETQDPPSIPTMSGFLLRSVAVADWPGLRATGYEQKNEEDKFRELRLLRFERLSENLLLGLFQGTLQKLRLGRAVETLHFGLTKKKGHWAVSLRNPDTGAPETDTLSTKGAMRNQGTDRVVQAGSLANKLADHFGEKTFSSSEYTLQMVQSTREVVFNVPRQSTAAPDGSR